MRLLKRFSSIELVLCALACAALAAPLASAEDGPDTAPDVAGEADIGRDVRDLQTDIRPPDDDVADTAIVFSNFAGSERRVRCIAYDGAGEKIGRGHVGIPARGTRYIRASDLSTGAEFIGHVVCGARSSVFAAVVFVGGGLTDLPAVQHHGKGWGRIRIPLVITH